MDTQTDRKSQGNTDGHMDRHINKRHSHGNSEGHTDEHTNRQTESKKLRSTQGWNHKQMQRVKETQIDT